MYAGHPNQGMRNIQEILDAFPTRLDWTVFDVRGANQLPADPLAFDIYISTGGPGSPHDGDGEWDRRWFELLQTLWDHNNALAAPAPRASSCFSSATRSRWRAVTSGWRTSRSASPPRSA